MKCLPRIAGIFAGIIFVLWVLGILLSDRWLWSQWLAWIPALVVAFLLLCSSILFFLNRKKITGVVLLWLAITVASWHLIFSHRLFSNNNQTGDVTIVGWTMSHSKKVVAQDSAQIVVGLQGDITLLTHGWYVRGQDSINEWLDQGGYKVTDSQFTLLSKYEPLFVQTIIASDGIYISSFILNTTDVLGDVLVLWAIDLPSSVWVSKVDIALRVQHLLGSIDFTPPDIVIGDFNMTRNSVAMKLIFPELHDISEEVGVGFLSSFPMNFPLYHIDHTLMNNRYTPVRYELINPHIGRHQIQLIEIKGNPR